MPIPPQIVDRYLRERPTTAARWAAHGAIRFAARCVPDRFAVEPPQEDLDRPLVTPTCSICGPAPAPLTVQGTHDALVHLSGSMRIFAASLYRIANDIRMMSCGPRAGFAELTIPENETGSPITPGKVNPTQVEALEMVSAQVIGDDVVTDIDGASGYLKMKVYKPLITFDITQRH